jgi:hypothetical protein
MALLRWIYLRKLTPIEDLIQSAGSSRDAAAASGLPPALASSSARATARSSGALAEVGSRIPSAAAGPSAQAPVSRASAPAQRQAAASVAAPQVPAPPPPTSTPPPNLKDALLSEIRSTNAMAYNALVAQAQRMEVAGDRVVLTFSAAQKIGPTFEKYKPALEALATKLAGRRMSVAADIAAAANGEEAAAGSAESERKKSALREQALADAGVQALLEVFPAEIRDVEEM